VLVDEVMAVAERVWGELADEVAAMLAEVELAVVDDPDEIPDGAPDDVRGCFVGTQQSDGGEGFPTTAKGTVYLVASRIHDGDEVEATLLHELGHALGMDEDEVKELGL